MESPVQIGQRLGHYEVVGHLGRGGMGEVWEAEDTKLKRRVALKVLPPHLAANPERLERFQREAETVAALNHPNIVTIYSVERDEALDIHFLTMELVEGKTLAALQPPAGFQLDCFFEMALPLSAAIAGAHEKGVTHRDLKPANVMVNEAGHVKVLDFGLAKFQQQTPGDDATRAATEWATGEGVVLGTVSYMSPEQAEGKPLDDRTDIFSLGVMLYEMATGRRPFTGDTPASTTSAILRDAPPSIEALQPKLPRQLARIIGQCLEKKPEARFQTARDVRNQLRALQREIDVESSSSPSQAPSAPAPTRATRFTFRPAWLGAAAAVVVVAALVWWLIPGNSSPTGDSAATTPRADGRQLIAVLPFENLGPPDREYFAAGMTDEITSRLAAVDGIGVTSRTTVVEYDRAGKTLSQIGIELGVDYILEATLRWQESPDGDGTVRFTPQLIRVADDTHLWAENYDRVIENMFAVQSEIAERVLDQIGVTLQASQRATPEGRGTPNPAAYDAYLRGSESLAAADELYQERYLQDAIAFLDEAVALDPDFALAHAKLAVAHNFAIGMYYDRTESRQQRARAAAEEALRLAPGLPEAHLALGYLYSNELEYDLALSEYELAARGRPGDSLVYQAIAESHWYVGNTDEAIVNYRRAFALDPQRANLYCSTGGVYRMTGEFEEAVDYHDTAVAIRPERACPHFCLAFIYLNAEGPERARAYLETVPPDIVRDDFPPIDYPWLLLDMIEERYDEALRRLDSGSATAYNWRQFYLPKSLLRGHVYALTGQPEMARQAFDEARAGLEVELLARPGDSRLYSALGLAYAGLGRKDDAIREGRRGVALLPYEKDKFAGPYRLKDMAQIYAMVGETEQALDALEILMSIPSEIHMLEITLDPSWHSLRDNPRFQALQRTD